MTREREPQPRVVRIPVQIEKVLEVEGVFIKLGGTEIKASTFVYAHVSPLVKTSDGSEQQYALLALAPANGRAYLGEIDPETRIFTPFDQSKTAYYDRSDNNVIGEISVPADQFEKLSRLTDVLGIEGLKIRRELIPTTNPTGK